MSKRSLLPVFIFCGKSPIGASGGGYSAFAYNLAKILRKIGHETFIVALGEEDKIVETEVGHLLLMKASLLNFNITALPGLPIFSFIFAKGVNKVARERGFKKYVVWGIGPWGFAGTLVKFLFNKNVIHVNNYFTTTKHEWSGALKALVIRDFGLFIRLKYWFICHTVVAYLTVLESILLRSADMVITNYKSTEDIIKEQFGIHPSRFKRAAFSVEVYKRSVGDVKVKANLKLPKKYFAFISRHDPRKGVNFLLHAMKNLQDKRVTAPLFLGGTGDMFEANKKLAEKLGLRNVRFLGFVNDPRPLLENCSVFVFPSSEEGAGALTINEAMSLGLPIVSTACDGIIEDIDDGVSGLLVPMEDPVSLARAMEELLNNPSRARRLGQNAKKGYKERFSFERMYKDMEKITRAF